MTENEAARYLQALTFNISRRKLPRDTETINTALEAVAMGMKALEEIQQYRALGTVEEIEPYIRLAEKMNLCDLVREIASVYNNLRFMEIEFQEAVEKQRAKKPLIQRSNEKILYKCPCCGSVFVEAYKNSQRGYIPKYCEMCGQSINFRLIDQ